MIIYCCSFYQVPAYCMQMMNYHKVSEQDRIKFEMYMLLTVTEESYNTLMREQLYTTFQTLRRTFGELHTNKPLHLLAC